MRDNSALFRAGSWGPTLDRRAINLGGVKLVEIASSNGSLTPGGTVTLLLIDIEGSIQLLAKPRDHYEVFISAHHQIIRDAISTLYVYRKELQQ